MAEGLNTGRVVLGGLVAGVLFFAGDFGMNATVMKDSMAEMVSAHNLVMDESAGGFLGWLIDDLVFGVLTIWVYAAIRPRFGAGPRTAIYAGLAVWLAVMLTLFGFSSMGLFSTGVFLTIGALWLVVVLIGAVAGAAVYTEAA